MTKTTQPDWGHWRHMPEVELWQACALTLNLEPDDLTFSRNDWMAGPGDHGPFIEAECFRDEEQQRTFQKRLRLLKANRHLREHFSPGTLNMAESHRGGVRLAELAAWATGIGWSLPAPLLALVPATPTIAKPPATRPMPTGANSNRQSTQTHELKRRDDALAAVLDLAKKKALDAKSWQSVWASLVALAQSSDRPAPLLGYTEGEGVKYQTDNADKPDGWLTREAYRARFNRQS
jgi:hypothetical protein